MTNVRYFAHERLVDYDTFTQYMSESNRQWQRKFLLSNCEVGLPKNNPIHDNKDIVK